MLTMLRVPPRGGEDSDTTEEIVRQGYPYYIKKNNGHVAMARNVPRRRESKRISLLGQAFGIREPKRRSSVDALEQKKKKRKKKPVQYLLHPQVPFPAPLPPQQFPNFPPPFAPIIPQQPFAGPNNFVAANSGFPSFHPMPGFPPPPIPAPAPVQPVRWAFPRKEPNPPSVEELLKAETDFIKRAKSNSRRRGREHNDHTEIKTTTTTTITKHICARCKRDRSMKYHLDHPTKAGEIPPPGFCRRCRRNATSTSSSSSDDSDDDSSRKHGDGGRWRRKERGAKKKDRRHSKSRLHAVEVPSRAERRDNVRSNDYRDEIIVEEEAVHERKSQSQRSYTRTREGDLASAYRRYARNREEDAILSDGDPTAKESKVRINITNQSSSATPPSLTPETREKLVHFDQPTGKSNYSQAASARNLQDQYKYVEPLRFATSHASLPRSARVSREPLPSLRTRNHAQRRRSERAPPEQTYDHDIREQVYDPLPRHHSDDEDIIVVETEHEQPKSRTESRTQPRHHPRTRSSDEDVITVETEHKSPAIRTEYREEMGKYEERRRSPVRTPVRTRETYITSEIDQYGNRTQYKWTASSSSSSPPQRSIPSSHHTSASVNRSSTANVRHYSDSSEEYQRALAIAYQNLPDPGPRRRPRNSFRSSGGGFDGAHTPPEVPDPPTDNGFWEPRNARMLARGTQSRGRGRSTFQSYVSRVPQHQSTPRGHGQPWKNASSIDRRNQGQEQYNKSHHSRISDSQTSSGSMVTQSDSLRTSSPPDSPEANTNSTAQSMTPRPVSVHETTDSGNEVESTADLPSLKATLSRKPVDPSHRQHDKNHDIGLASQKYKDKLGSYASYVEYVTPNDRICSKDKAIADGDDDDNNPTILDDATDLTLRTARSMAAIKARIHARRVSFAENDEFEPTPEQSRDNFWGADNNENQSWGDNSNDANGDDSWAATTSSNDFWSPDDGTGGVPPDVGSYSGPPNVNANNLDFGGTTNTCGFDYAKGFAPTSKTKSGHNNNTGGDGSDGNNEGGDQEIEDEWGPIPAFSSLGI
ncbi:hypothetical protein DSL72_006106 [Monilinia vaccinii-corymbosi]|uniref:Uncharacterized protein n=1 Tax=Monilinia vaccinii-corymbosi TaxID=61207 RepID=A0A8A3PGT7_9HELO|nr:hypothetical protein DSL72_006106 [Monilinia vaccinii-corymbosi]